MPERALQLLTVVAPMLDEEDTARRFHARVAGALDGLPWELVVVDDGSTDATPQVLDALAAQDARVRVIHLSRRFGHQSALTAGLDHAAGDVVVMLDGDLQDPPELILTMLDRWREGADVVYAARTHRDGETPFKLATPRGASTGCSAACPRCPWAARPGTSACWTAGRWTRCWACASATATCAA
jgi:dolichol-phosphate mannosyltransferase